jgi:hypothetical protein
MDMECLMNSLSDSSFLKGMDNHRRFLVIRAGISRILSGMRNLHRMEGILFERRMFLQGMPHMNLALISFEN